MRSAYRTSAREDPDEMLNDLPVHYRHGVVVNNLVNRYCGPVGSRPAEGSELQAAVPGRVDESTWGEESGIR